MRSRFLAYASVVVAIPLVATTIYFGLFANSWEWGLGFGWISLLAVLTALSISMFISFPFIVVFTFLAPFPLDVTKSVGAPSVTEVMQRLSRRGYQVRRSGDKVIIRFDKWMSMKLVIRSPSTGTRYIGRLSPTSNTEAVIILSIFIWFLSFVIPLVCIYLLFKMDRYSSGHILQALSPDQTVAKKTENDVHDILIEGLADAHGVVSEAYWSAKEAAVDAVVLLVALSLISGTMIFLFLYGTLSFQEGDRIIWSFLIALAVTFAGALAAYFVVRRRESPELRSMEIWVERISQRMAEETSAAHPYGHESTVEMLIGANEEMPRWLRSRRKGAWSRYPGSGLVLFFLLTWAASWAISGISSLRFDPYTSVLAMLVTLGLGLGAAVLTYFVRKWDREEQVRIEKEWSATQDQILDVLEGNSPPEG